jgi:allophanate hydrolase
MLRTMADWRDAVRAPWDVGTEPPWAGLLRQRLQRLRLKAAPCAWIMLIDDATLQARLAALQAMSSGMDAQAVLARWPLFAVPFAVKDNIDAAGLPTTAACPAWAHTAAADATVVRRLLAAGAVLLGKTNLDQFATGLVGTRSPYGAPSSVPAPGRVSGGSSSGSAVAVAAVEVAFALGTDTAGSGRVPAAFNAVVGLKPTPGRVPTTGVLPACRSIDCVSVFAHTVADAAAVLALIEGDDAADPYAAFLPGPARLSQRPLRVAVPKAPVLDAALGYDLAWAAALQHARALGWQVTGLDMAPLHEVAAALYEGPWVAERAAAMRPLLDRDPAAIDPTVRGIVAGASRFSAEDAHRAAYALRGQRREAAALWQAVDVLMVPSAPRHPRFDEVAAEPVAANAVLGTYTNFVNLLGWCALALPAGRAVTAEGEALPFGITLIAPGGADAALAALGQAWEAGPHGPGPGAMAAPVTDAAPPWPAVEATLDIAVVGAHLSGLPLNSQLTERGAWLLAATRTAPCYRLFELPGTQPPKPGLLRVAEGGQAIEVEVWRVPQRHVGSLLALIPPPLGLGSVELDGGARCTGFLCEAVALEGARDITVHGGWRAWLAHRAAGAAAATPPSGAPPPVSLSPSAA